VSPGCSFINASLYEAWDMLENLVNFNTIINCSYLSKVNLLWLQNELYVFNNVHAVSHDSAREQSSSNDLEIWPFHSVCKVTVYFCTLKVMTCHVYLSIFKLLLLYECFLLIFTQNIKQKISFCSKDKRVKYEEAGHEVLQNVISFCIHPSAILWM